MVEHVMPKLPLYRNEVLQSELCIRHGQLTTLLHEFASRSIILYYNIGIVKAKP